MAGFNLLNIGTALGGFIGGYDDARQKQQKEQQEQLKSLAAMQTYRQQQEDRQRETQAATGYVKSAQDLPDLSGLGMGQPGGAPTGWGGMGQQPQPPAPAAQPASFSPSSQGGATQANYPFPNLGANRQFPALPPRPSPMNTAMDLAPGPGRVSSPISPQPDDTRMKPGPNDNAVAQLNAQPATAQTAGGKGDRLAPLGAVDQLAQAGGTGGAQPDALIPPHVQQQVQQGAQQTARGIDPMVQGRMSVPALARAVEKNMPDADPVAKAMVLDKLIKALAPSEQHMWKQFATENQHAFQLGLKDMQIANQNQRQQEQLAAQSGRADEAGWDILTDPKTSQQYRYNKRTLQATTLTGEPYKPQGAQKVGTTAQGPVSPEARSLMADGIANYQLPPLASWALKSPEGQATMAAVMKKNPDYDATKYTGKQSGARAMGTRSASLTMATDVAEEQIPLVQQTSDRIDRTQYPTINSMILAMDKGTGGEDIVRFLEQINTLKYVYARALNPTGTARIQDLERFDNILNEAWSKGQISAALDQMKISLAAERRGVDRAMTGKPATDSAAKPGAPAQPGGSEEVIQNGWRYRKEGEQYVPVGPAQ